LSRDEANQAAASFLVGGSNVDATARRLELLNDPDVLTQVCGLLAREANTNPSRVAVESEALYRLIESRSERIGAFDETDYFLGETALIAGSAGRTLGQLDDAEMWLDRAEAGFRHTVNPTPQLARVTYQRLALRYDRGHYKHVIEMVPMLGSTFGRLNMAIEQAKCVFLHALALKESSDSRGALAAFRSLNRPELSSREPGLVGSALVHMADLHASEGKDDLAEQCCGAAIPLLRSGSLPAAVAQLHGTFGDILRRQGRTVEALSAYQSAVSGYDALGMSTMVAYLRVVIGEAMLEAGMVREAEWQVLAALPTIDQQGMVPEGFAAVAVLRESIRQRRTDPRALAQLREHLQANT
jgi:tetratricopeptide (TPR) repeat protein